MQTWSPKACAEKGRLARARIYATTWPPARIWANPTYARAPDRQKAPGEEGRLARARIYATTWPPAGIWAKAGQRGQPAPHVGRHLGAQGEAERPPGATKPKSVKFMSTNNTFLSTSGQASKIAKSKAQGPAEGISKRLPDGSREPAYTCQLAQDCIYIYMCVCIGLKLCPQN